MFDVVQMIIYNDDFIQVILHNDDIIQVILYNDNVIHMKTGKRDWESPPLKVTGSIGFKQHL